MECFYCHKKDHLKKDCFKLKNKSKGKEDDQNAKVDNSKAIVPRKGGPQIEELNAVLENNDDDILYASSCDDASLTVSNSFHAEDWLLDSGASDHVTPHRKWFATYDESKLGCVRHMKRHLLQLQIAFMHRIDCWTQVHPIM